LMLACSSRREPAESSAGHVDAALLFFGRARAAAESGIDPWPLSLRGLSELDKARILDKSDAQVVEELARAHVFLADHRLRAGRSAAELAAAQHELDAAADIAPDLLELSRLRAQVAALAW